MDRKYLATIAIEEAEKLRIKANLSYTGIADPIEIAEDICGCKVRFQALSTLEGIYSPKPVPIIVIGSERPYGRQMFTCAHEIGHHIFGHGEKLDMVKTINPFEENSDEVLVDMFAGYFLMPNLAIRKALRDRAFSALTLKAEQAYRLANYFRIGYGALVTHISSSLNILRRDHAKALLKIKPAAIKKIYGVPASASAHFVDYHWENGSIDIAVGDYLFVPDDCFVETNDHLRIDTNLSSMIRCKAHSVGYARIMNKNINWGMHVRIYRTKYEGLPKYRFLAEEDDSIE